MSCIDCAVKLQYKMDKTYPDFCLTTHMDEEVLNEAMECYNEDENRKVTIAAAEVEYEELLQNIPVSKKSWILQRRINAKRSGSQPVSQLLKESRIWQISCADMALRCMVSAVKPEHRRRHRSASRNAAKVSV